MQGDGRCCCRRCGNDRGEADVEVKDAGLIAAAQRVEHYEMAGYGTARTYAELLGDKEGAKLLALTLEEERQTDQSCHN